MPVELAFRFPLHTLTAPFLLNPIDNAMCLLVLISSLLGLAAPHSILIFANTRPLAFLAPIRKTVSSAAILAKLSFSFSLPAFRALFHCTDPPNWESTLSAGSLPALHLKPHLLIVPLPPNKLFPQNQKKPNFFNIPLHPNHL